MKRARTAEQYYEGDYNQVSKNIPIFIYRQKSLDFFRRHNPDAKPLKLLDIGSDNGRFSAKIKALGYDVHGLEIRKKEVAASRKLGIKAVHGSAEERFPFPDASFDAAYAGDIIEHLYDTDFFISEVHRVLRPGGVFAVTTPNLASLSNRVRLLLGKLPIGSEIRLGKDMAGHIRNYTFPTLAAQLKDHHFKIIRKVSSNIIFPVRYRVPILRTLAIRMGDYTPNIGSHIIMVAKK